jgi:hypothetical protein
MALYEPAPEPRIVSVAELLAEPPPTFETKFREEQAEREERFPKFAALVAIEPALGIVEQQVLAIKRAHHYQIARDRANGVEGGVSFCANDCWHGRTRIIVRKDGERVLIVLPSLKAQLNPLVGWFARAPELRTSEAWDTAYKHLYKLLPDCRRCGCV